jgi:hypothetical protein
VVGYDSVAGPFRSNRQNRKHASAAFFPPPSSITKACFSSHRGGSLGAARRQPHPRSAYQRATGCSRAPIATIAKHVRPAAWWADGNCGYRGNLGEPAVPAFADIPQPLISPSLSARRSAHGNSRSPQESRDLAAPQGACGQSLAASPPSPPVLASLSAFGRCGQRLDVGSLALDFVHPGVLSDPAASSSSERPDLGVHRLSHSSTWADRNLIITAPENHVPASDAERIGCGHKFLLSQMRPGLACQLRLPQRVSTRTCAGHARESRRDGGSVRLHAKASFSTRSRLRSVRQRVASELTIHTDDTAARNDERNRIGGASVCHHASSDLVDQPSQLHVANCLTPLDCSN